MRQRANVGEHHYVRQYESHLDCRRALRARFTILCRLSGRNGGQFTEANRPFEARWTSERLTSPQSRRRGAADASSCGPGGGLV